MPRSGTRRTVRWLGALLVLALAATAVALVVLGDSQKQLRIGVLLGIWAAVIAYFLPRSREEEDGPPVTSAADEAGRSLAVREANQLSSRAAADQRRDYEVQLERMLRRQIEQAMREQLAQVRREVASLRSDLVENVNGQLRLERVETTRVIGSDIEALQREVRRLAVSRDLLLPAPSLSATGAPSSTSFVVTDAPPSASPTSAAGPPFGSPLSAGRGAPASAPAPIFTSLASTPTTAGRPASAPPPPRPVPTIAPTTVAPTVRAPEPPPAPPPPAPIRPSPSGLPSAPAPVRAAPPPTPPTPVRTGPPAASPTPPPAAPLAPPPAAQPAARLDWPPDLPSLRLPDLPALRLPDPPALVDPPSPLRPAEPSTVGANVDPFRDLPRLGTFSDALPDDLPPGPADRYVGRRRAAADDPGRRR